MNAYTIATDPFLVSNQMLQDSAFDVDALCHQLIGEAIGRKLADYALTGTGSGQPQGVFTTITARGEVTTSGGWVALGTATPVNVFGAYGDSATTELLANALSPATVASMISSVNSAYWPGCRFFMSSTQALNQRSVTDDNGRPLLNLDDGYADGATIGPCSDSRSWWMTAFPRSPRARWVARFSVTSAGLWSCGLFLPEHRLCA